MRSPFYPYKKIFICKICDLTRDAGLSHIVISNNKDKGGRSSRYKKIIQLIFMGP